MVNERNKSKRKVLHLTREYDNAIGRATECFCRAHVIETIRIPRPTTATCLQCVELWEILIVYSLVNSVILLAAIRMIPRILGQHHEPNKTNDWRSEYKFQTGLRGPTASNCPNEWLVNMPRRVKEHISSEKPFRKSSANKPFGRYRWSSMMKQPHRSTSNEN